MKSIQSEEKGTQYALSAVGWNMQSIKREVQDTEYEINLILVNSFMQSNSTTKKIWARAEQSSDMDFVSKPSRASQAPAFGLRQLKLEPAHYTMLYAEYTE